MSSANRAHQAVNRGEVLGAPPLALPARPSTLSRRVERDFKRLLTRALVRLLRPAPVAPATVVSLPARAVLVVRQHNQLGDMVLALPALRVLRRAYPEARLTFVTSPLCEDLLTGYPDIDELVVYRKQEMWRLWMLIGLVRRLRRASPDLAIVLGAVSFSATSAILARASGARIRVGASSLPFGSELSRALYHLEWPVVSNSGELEVHELEHNLAPLRALGFIVPATLRPELVASDAAIAHAAVFLAAAFGDASDPKRAGPKSEEQALVPPLVVLHAGAGKAANIWPAERFAAVVRALRGAGAGARVVLSEGPVDRPIIARVEQCVGVGETVRWCRPIAATLGLLHFADLVISNDTGLAHVAAAVGTRVIVLFGPTNAKRWRPPGEHVRWIESPTGRIEGVSVASVLDVARQQLGTRCSSATGL